jgi:2-polyprenyl-3-methyl-5-hydroxy-6-metoxy-1,4-benzoquinol methylase
VKTLDRILQRWRIRKVRPYLRDGCRVLDVGCDQGTLLALVPTIGEYVGIDPNPECLPEAHRHTIIRGHFPRDLPDVPPFDAVTMLAVLEHIPSEKQAEVARACARVLKPGGCLLVTVPEPIVDKILDVLTLLRLVDGIAIEEHYGYDPRKTEAVFSAGGLRLLVWRKFQFGLNNLFVFERP